jgi:exodeoxyribonuclease VII large subunit
MDRGRSLPFAAVKDNQTGNLFDATRDSERVVWSVSELTRDIKLDLEGRFMNLWVEGELSNVKRPSSGHLYFTLKDDRAQLPGVMFRSSAARGLRFRPTDGMAVLVWGHLTVYEPRGAYQIRVERMEPRGKGALQLAFEQLKAKLSQEGLFDEDRKRPLPLLPQRLGIVTSPTGAAIRDLCRILHRRYPNLEVLIYPAQVQGDLAAADIAKGVQVLNKMGGFDILIVARGGGSLEDLWPFNEESVARAIAASRIPVVSAVGHETDVTIADFAADVRAPTPSAAAEIVVRRKDDFQERVEALGKRLAKARAFRFSELARRLERAATHGAFAAVRHFVELKGQRVDEAGFRARTSISRRIVEATRRLDSLERRLEARRIDRRIGESRARWMALRARLDAAERTRRETARRAFSTLGAKLETLSPLGVLGRGYSLTWTDRGKLLRRARDVQVGDALRIDLHEGSVDCRVENISPSEREPKHAK